MEEIIAQVIKIDGQAHKSLYKPPKHVAVQVNSFCHLISQLSRTYHRYLHVSDINDYLQRRLS